MKQINIKKLIILCAFLICILFSFETSSMALFCDCYKSREPVTISTTTKNFPTLSILFCGLVFIVLIFLFLINVRKIFLISDKKIKKKYKLKVILYVITILCFFFICVYPNCLIQTPKIETYESDFSFDLNSDGTKDEIIFQKTLNSIKINNEKYRLEDMTTKKIFVADLNFDGNYEIMCVDIPYRCPHFLDVTSHIPYIHIYTYSDNKLIYLDWIPYGFQTINYDKLTNEIVLQYKENDNSTFENCIVRYKLSNNTLLKSFMKKADQIYYYIYDEEGNIIKKIWLSFEYPFIQVENIK